MFDSCLHVQAQASSLFLVWSFAHFLLSRDIGMYVRLFLFTGTPHMLHVCFAGDVPEMFEPPG